MPEVQQFYLVGGTALALQLDIVSLLRFRFIHTDRFR